MAGTRASTSPRAACLALAALSALVASCSSRCAPGRWQLEFDDSRTAATARSILVTVRAGSCAAPGALLYSATLVPGAASPVPSMLAAGTYALEAEALDDRCRVIASNCRDFSGSACASIVTQSLRNERAGMPVCASCLAGVCSAADAGFAGDGGPRTDGGPSGDGGSGADAACRAREDACGDGLDEDCDGRTDCADADCEGRATTRCGGMMDREGTCRGGSCCDDCWDGTACVRSSPTACGTGGAACVDCGSCSCEPSGTCRSC